MLSCGAAYPPGRDFPPAVPAECMPGQWNLSATRTGPNLIAITIDPVDSSVAVGTSRQLAATCEFPDDTTKDCTSQVAWTSSNPGVASVGTQGLTSGVGVGATTITATLDGVTGSSAFAVTKASLMSITVQPDPVLAKGTMIQLAAIGNFGDGTTEDLTNQATWTSGNSAIAQVSAGLVTGLGVGNTAITATLDGVPGSTNITVTAATLTALTITPPTASIANGTNVQLRATGSYSDKTAQDVTSQVSWSSSNGSIAQVSNGLTTGFGVGNTSIIATLNGVQGAATITVTPAILTAITITPPELSIANGTEDQLVATCNFSDGMTQDCTMQVSWASSNDAIAQDSDLPATMGLVTGVGVGNTTILATLKGVQGSAAISVTPAILTAITITPPTLSIADGTAVQATATGNFSDGTTEDFTDEVSWTAGDNAIAEASDILQTKGLITGLAVGNTSITATLTGIQGTAPITVTPAILTSITIDPPDSSLANGTMLQLTATGNFSDGTTEDLTDEVSWISNDDSIAQISDVLQSKGLITGMAAGNATIIATLNGIQGSATLTVTPAILTSITITPPILAIANGTSEQVAATCNLSDGTTEDCTDEVSWTSGSNPTMQISDAHGSQGLVTGLALGDTSITATLNGIQATATINVMPATLTSITVTPPDASLADGTTVQATATGNFSDSTTEDLTGEVSWTSSNNATAQASDAVQTKGLITGMAVGNTSIIATLNGMQGSTTVTVTAAVLTSITITPPNGSFASGTQNRLAATCVFSDSTTENCTTQVSWTSGNNAIAQVSNLSTTKGLVRARAVGGTSITATLNGVQGSATVTITRGKLTGILVTPAKSLLANGTSVQATATGKFSDNSTQDLTNDVGWTSANNSFAQVSNAPTSKGRVFGVGVGDATIIATLNGVKGSTIFKVLPAAVSTITITPPELSIADGTMRQLASTCNFTDGTTQDCTTLVSWTSGNNSIVEVSNYFGSRGVAAALSVGSTTVLATYRGIQGTAAITVTPAVVTSASITPPNPSIANGTTVQLNATANFSDGTTQDLTDQVSWTSGNNSIAQVSDAPGSKGLVTGLGVGSATITATLNGTQRSITITVTPAVLTSVFITPPNPSIADGTTVQLNVTANFSDGTTQDLTDQVSWTSSNDTIVEISDASGTKGLVTGLAVGSASITATLNGTQRSITVTVTPAVLTSVSIAPPNPSIADGATVQLRVIASLSDGTTQDLTNQVGWTSGNNAIAQVSNVPGTNGVVTGLAAGSTSITATLNGKQRSTTVTITPAILTSLTIDPVNPSIANGATTRATATGNFSDGSTEDLTAQVSWTSGDDLIAQVSDVAGTKGLIRALGVGTTSIIAILNGVQGSTMVTVTPAALTTLTITPPNPSVASGTSVQLRASGVFTDQSSEDLTGQVSWTSGNDATAHVSDGWGARAWLRVSPSGTPQSS